MMAVHFLLPASILAALSWMLAANAQAAEDPVGKKAPEWDVTDWMNSKPLSLKDQVGKVILVRWWTAPGCPFCEATVPALNEFHTRYKDKGLVVIGFYHHKESTPLSPAKVKESAATFGFKFPVAIDREWRTLHRWWLDDHERKWTSVTFVIDRQGTIRHIHPGGQYVKGDKAYTALKAKIEELLQEK
jgi:peroxiredoxin